MPKKHHFEATLYVVFAIVLIAAAIVFVFLFPKNDAAHTLRSSGYSVDIKDSTFRGFVSQKISADKGHEQVMVRIVKGVTSADSDGILRELNESVQNIRQRVVITDPYSGRQQELSIPESLGPVKETIVIKGNPLTYFIVYANDILSMKIFSEAEAKNRGIFSTFYCPGEKAVYMLEIYSDAGQFNKQNQLSLLSSLFCKQK